MIPFKPAAFFGIPVPTTGFGKLFGVSGLNGPIAPAGTFSAGVSDGEVLFDATDIPDVGEWGDAAEPGDGLGTAGTLQIWSSLDDWNVLVDPAATGEHSFTTHPGNWGRSTMFRVRAANAEGVSGRTVSGTVTPPGAIQVITALEDDSGNALEADSSMLAVYEEEA